MKTAKPSRRRVPVQFCRPFLEHLEDRVCPSALSDLATALTPGSLSAVQSGLNSALDSVSKLPLLTQAGAGALSKAKEVQIVTDALVGKIQSALAGAADEDAAKTALVSALGLASSTDVIISHPSGAGSIEVEIHLHRNLLDPGDATLPTSFNLDLGLPGLPVNIHTGSTATINAQVSYDYAFGVGYEGSNLVVYNATKLSDFSGALPDHQLALHAEVKPSATFQASATVGLLQAVLTENQANSSKLSADFTVDNLGLTGSPSPAFTGGSANLNLHAAASFGAAGDANTTPFQFPGIGADLVINWANVLNGIPDVSFNNVGFQLGTFLSGFVDPILKDIQVFTKPMQPIDDVLTAPLPGLSDLSHLIGAGDITILGIAEAYGASGGAGPGFGKLIQLIGILTDISKGLNSIDANSGNLFVPLGGFALDTHNASDPTVLNALKGPSVDFSKLATHGADLAADLFKGNGLLGSDVVKGIDAVADKLHLTGDARAALEKIGQVLEPNFNLNFPILDDPASVIFPLLLGREGSDMVSLDAHFDFNGPVLEKSYGMFGIGIGAKFSVGATGNIHLGYDTYGLREFFGDLDPVHLLDGFYVSDDSHITISASLGIEAKVTYAVFSASVEGGAFTGDSDPISIGFHDPDKLTDDGRLRLTKLGADVPHHRVLDVTGTLKAGVRVEIAVGYDPPIGPFIGYKHTFEIASVTLLDLGNIDRAANSPLPPPNDNVTGHLGPNGIPSANPPVIAGDNTGNANTDADGISHVGADGILYLYLGADPNTGAGKRANGPPNTDDKDTPENWEVSQESDGLLTVKAFGVSQTFAGITKIKAVGKVAKQAITIDEGVTAYADLTGGDGDDQLTYRGSGTATLNGGKGNDRLATGPKSQASVLNGNEGDDVLIGGGGSDKLYGDAGKDSLFAGDGNQTLDGGDGDDQLTAGNGNDSLYGGAHVGGGTDLTNNDLISWHAGNGTPVVNGGDGTNTLEVLGDGNGNHFTASASGNDLSILADAVTFGASNIQKLSLDGKGGASSITVHSLEASIQEVHVNQSQILATGAAAHVVVDAGPSQDVLVDEAVGAVKPAVEGAQALISFRDNKLSYKVFVSNTEAIDSLTLNTGSAATTVTIDLLKVDPASADPGASSIPLRGQIEIKDAPNPNVFNIKSTSGATIIDASGGGNTFNVGSLAPATGGTLAGITSSLTLNGSGSDTTNIDDSGDTTDRTGGMLTSTQVTGLGNTGAITYSGMSALSIGLGKGNDHFIVASTHAGTTTVDGGPGNDTIDLLALYGPTTVHGGDDTDRITLDATIVVGPTYLYGDNADDQLTVNHLPNGQVATLDGGAGADSDTVNIAGFGGSVVNVTDSGAIGSDTLTVNGSGQADNFLLRAAWAPVPPVVPPAIPPEPVPVPNGIAFVAALHGDPVSSVERVNYTMGATRALPVLKALVLDMKAGDDSATLDDNAADTTVYGGAGGDRFQVGQIFKSPRDALAGVAARDAFTTVSTTRGFLSNGVSYVTTINGDDNRDSTIPGGNDVFVVFHNTREVNLNGDAGDDLFTVRAFALEGSTDTNISGGKDVNLIQYVLNAQVNVDGGEGIDTLRIIGTEFADRFLITDAGIFGAGLNVKYKNIEKFQVDGAEGDDEFYVLSTGLKDPVSHNLIDVTLFGGLGNDLFSIAGDSAELPVGTTTDAQGHTVPVVHDATVESHMVKFIQGSLTVDGAGGKGSAGGLGKPVMLPGETSLLTSDGAVLAYTGTGTSLSIDTMTVSTLALLTALPREFPLPLLPTLADLVGKTLQVSTGPGIDRFWQITGLAVGATTTVLTLKSPGVPADEWGLPDNTSGFKVTHLSPNFFVSETDTLDSLTVFNDGSTTNDAGALSATQVTGLGMSAAGITYANMESVEVLLGIGDDTFTVTSTAAGAITAVHGGGGTDHIYVNGGGGMGSPLLVYGDTTQDRSRYSSDGKKSTAGFYNPDSVTPKPGAAFMFANDGGDTIDASLDTQTVAIYGGGGNDTIYGSQSGDHLAGGAGDDEIHGQAGADQIYGDSGFNQNLTTRLDRVTPASQIQILQVVTSETAGNDRLFGDAGDDIIFGDHGVITQADGTQRIFTTGNVVRVETTNLANGGNDEIQGGADNDVELGGAGNDLIDGNDGQDLILGDHGVLTSRAGGVMTSPRFRTLGGAQLYDSAGNAQVTAAWQTAPGTLPTWANWLITLTDGYAGNDYLAGGAGNDTIFGQAGDDAIQGDGSIRLDVGTVANPKASVEDFDHFDAGTGLPVSAAGNDGDDYVEGGPGSDLVFGNLGQDDLIGGSSSLFGTVTAGLRSDGADTIFGGAGTRSARNDLGDLSAAGHARDADTILGDNGNIFRTLGANGGYLSFNYDNYGPSKITPRAIVLLDYTPGGNAADQGAADVLHGEGGDDEIHGQTGNDVIFGEGQDDDLYGEAGSDRIYAGAGEDGVLGDDGRIQTSRNGLTETLYGLNAPNAQVNISIPGPFTGSWEYITGRVYKTVTVAAWAVGGNDMIYGGLGDDFLHAGAGDDAVSGAEAQAAFYNSLPVSNTNPLGYDPVTRKLAAYDANNPLTRIAGFFLNFDAVDTAGQKIEDGKDRIFGDLGNDWLVGGTGNDRLFGGKGDDLLNADDNLDTAGGLNNQPDTALFADRDFVYGGDGLDVLIANTGGDRLFDWGGEFNTYVTSFSPYGAVGLYRSISPAIAQFLTDLGRTSGADQSLVDPNSETGLFQQSDPEWNQNLGGPRDPQAGNTQARRDTQGGPEDDRGTALPLAGTSAAAPVQAATQVNTFDVTINNVTVTKDPSTPSQLALFIGGGSGDDVIEVRRGSSANMLHVLVNSVDKGEFARTSSAGTIGRVIIYGNDGNDTITVNADVDPIVAVLYGGAGNDTLRGGAGNNVLDGGAGDDILTGNAAADILIGGSGLDTLYAGGGDDILIGGIYLPSEDLDAVAAILAEWASSLSYNQRIADLRSGVGANGIYQVNNTTVIDDGTADTLNGDKDQDWFWLLGLDQTDKKGNETVN